MFMQVIQGKVSDLAGFDASLDRWVSELSPDAVGWLGTTAGSYGEDLFIALVQFESPEAARRNSERPEQGEWWSEASSFLDGEADFAEYDDVTVLGAGPTEAAGFVQVMRGRVRDAARERAMTEQFATMPTDFRPDILGGLAGLTDDGTFTQAMYFTSEADAREGEQKPVPAELQKMMEDGQDNTIEMSFIDLDSPKYQFPRR